jgi:hypothetical protein
MLTKRPLLDTVADQQLLVLDDSRRFAVRTAFQVRNTLIVGEAGSGKTTLLFHMRAKATQPPHPRALAIYVDARRADGPTQLVDRLLATAVDEEWIPDAERPNPDDPFGLEKQLRRLEDAPKGSLILLDDLDREQAAILFGRMRDVLFQLPVRFTVAVGEATLPVLSRPPANAFFDIVTQLQPLDPDAAFELLRLRKERGEIDQIIPPRDPAQPRSILLDAEAGPTGIRHDSQLQHELITRAERAAGRSGAMVLAEVWNQGATSASDESLSRALGVTRTRLSKILRALHTEGVLITVNPPVTEKGATGRPKIYYDINRVP